MSYLGKISALVTVNTGDFAPKLNAAAKEVRSFAKTVESNIGSSMRDAGRAFEGIYTPLQRFEKAMRAASSAKLAFIGVPGAIRTIDELQKRLYSLNDRQVSVVLKASGMKSLDAFRQAIQGLSQKNINILAKVGGIDELKALREQMIDRSGGIEIDLRTTQAKERLKDIEVRLAAAKEEAKSVPVGIAVDPSQLDKLEARMDRLVDRRDRLVASQMEVQIGSEQFKRFDAVIDTIDSKVEALNNQHAATTAISDVERLTGEAQAARSELDELQKQLSKKVGLDTATGLNIKQIDEAIESLKGVGMSAAQAKLVVESLLQSDSAAFVSTMRTMKSVVEDIFKPIAAVEREITQWGPAVQRGIMPALKSAQTAAESLRRSIEAAAQAGKQPSEETLKRYQRALDVVQRLEAASGRIGRISAAASRVRGPSDPLTVGVEEDIRRSQGISDSASGLSAASLARSPGIGDSVSRVAATTQKLAELFSRLQNRIAKDLPVEKVEAQLERLRERLRKYQADAEKKIRVELDAEDAQRDILDLRKYVKDVRDQATFKIIGDFENIAQVKAALSEAISALDKFDEKQSSAGRASRADLRAPLEVMLSAADQGDFKAFQQAYEQFQKKVAAGVTLNVNADKAAADVREIEASLDELRRQIATFASGGINIPVTMGAGDSKASIDQIVSKLASVVERTKQSMPAGLQSAMSEPFLSAAEAIGDFATKAASATGATVQDLRNLVRTINDLEASAERLSAIGDGVRKIGQAADVFSQARKRGPSDPVALLSEVVAKGTELTNRALALPRQFVMDNISELSAAFARYNALSEEALRGAEKRESGATPQARAGGTKIVTNRLPLIEDSMKEIERIVTIHLDTTEAQKKAGELDEAFSRLREDARFNLTGVIGVDQIQSSVAQINSLLANLQRGGASGRGRASVLQPDVESMLSDARAAAGGDEAALASFRQKYHALRQEIESGIEIVADGKRAEEELARLDAHVKRLRDDLDFKITGQFANSEQIKDAVSSLVSGIERLERVGDVSIRAQVSPKANDLRQNLAANLPAIQQGMRPGATDDERNAAKVLIDGLRGGLAAAEQFADGLARDDEEAKRLNKTLQDIAKFIIPTDPLEALRQAAQKARAEVEKIADATKRGGLESRLQAAGAQIGAATSSDEQRRLAAEFQGIGESARIEVKAEVDTNALRESLSVASRTLSGASSPMDTLKKSADEARAAVDKVADAAKRAQLQSRMDSVSASIAALADPKNPALAGMSPKQIARMQARQSAKLGQITADAGVASAPTSKDIFGDMLGSSGARLDALKSKIAGVQSGIAALPAPLQANMLPALAKVRDAFASLGATPAAKDLLAATKAADNLEKTLKRAQTAAQFRGTLRSFINDNAAKSYSAQLQQIRQGLVAVGATAGGPVAAAVNQYSKALQDAGKAGRLGTQATKQEMADLLKKIEQAAVATGLMTKKQAAQFAQSVQRAGKGDVGRMGADKFSLALNQAAFAVDDFMSSTGGIEFKLRAISNNITQLGFVIGGTYGLFVGLGAVIGGQLAVGILKFINNGRTAEDQTKALNDSLARQKNLVEELAEAFGSLTEAVSRGGLSAGAQRAADFDKQLTDTKKKQKELRREQAAVLDPDVQRERAQQGAYQKQLEASTDIGTRIDLEQRIRQSKEREKIAIDSAAGREPATAAEAADVISRSGQILFERRTRGEEVVTPEDAATLTRARSRADAALAASSPVEMRRALEAQREELGGISDDPRVSEQIRQLQVLIQSLDGPVEKALDELSNQIVQASRGVAIGIESAQKDVEDAIRRGVRGAADFQAALDNTSKQLRDAENQLVEAQKIEGDPDRREAEIRRAEDRIGDIRLRRDAIREQAREVRLGRTFGGERTEKALSDIQGNERFSNEYAGLTARLRAAVDKEMEARRLLEESIASGDSAEQEAARAALEAAQAEGDLAAAAAEAAKAIEEAFSRLRKILTNALADSERLADTAQQRFTEDPTAENRANRDAAEQQLIADRERVAKANNALDAKRSEVAASDPQIAMVDDEMADIRDKREQLAEQARIDGTEADPREMERLANREAELMAERERRLADLTKAEQGQIDTLAQETAARKKLIDAALAQYDAEIARGKKRDEEAMGSDGQRQQVDAAMGQSQSQYEARRQEYARNPTQANRQRLDEAERRMRADEEKRQEVQDDIDAAERGFQERSDIKAKRKDIDRREKRRAALIAKAKEEDRELTGPEKAEIDAIDEANRDDRSFIRGERASDPAVSDADRKAKDFTRRQELLTGADRGRDLALTDRERKKKEIEGVAFDIRARGAELESQGIDPNDYISKALIEQERLLAPMREEFNVERENALLQGPSRAALQVSDITSSQGQAELNRLLRGDDPAKDVNLAELRKQSGYLQDLVNAVRNSPLPVIP